MREVKRLLWEELGTCLESMTEVKNFQLTNDLLAYCNRGITYSLIGDSTRAVQDLSKAIKLHPDARSFADDPAFDKIRNTPEFKQLIGK